MKYLSKPTWQNLIILTIYTATALYIIHTKAPVLQIPAILSLLIIAVAIPLITRLSAKLSRLIVILYSLIFGIQLSAIALTGNYIDAVTITNLDEYNAISVAARIKIATIIIACILAGFLIKLPRKTTRKVTYFLLILFTVLTLAVTRKNIRLPAISFIKLAYSTTIKYHHHKKIDQAIKETQKKLYGKDYIVMSPDKDLITDVPNLKNKNIIVFFTEALSAKKIDLFNDYQDLTPNLSAFIKKSLYFDNYYNHTFTTYRGLRGQLSSSYQYTGIAVSDSLTKSELTKKFTSDLVTLPQILNQNGYHTYFLSGRSSLRSNLNTMLSTLGFNYIYTPADFNYQTDLFDQELFNRLTALMTKNKLQEPYFLAVYNIGTHFAENSPDLKYKDGANPLLNTTYNFDNAFGKWFNRIAANETILNNLVVILTADHATFADQAYCDTFNNLPEYWVDKIPLAVYNPQITPQTIDTKGRNSLDLAPTILHMLQINQAKNYFLGCSLFKPSCILPFDHYTISQEFFYKTQDNYVIPFPSLESWDKHILKLIEDFYHLSESFSVEK